MHSRVTKQPSYSKARARIPRRTHRSRGGDHSRRRGARTWRRRDTTTSSTTTSGPTKVNRPDPRNNITADGVDGAAGGGEGRALGGGLLDAEQLDGGAVPDADGAAGGDLHLGGEGEAPDEGLVPAEGEGGPLEGVDAGRGGLDAHQVRVPDGLQGLGRGGVHRRPALVQQGGQLLDHGEDRVERQLREPALDPLGRRLEAAAHRHGLTPWCGRVAAQARGAILPRK